ncbi:MAG: hypothetical protein ACQEXN_04970 [Actinomycetota bacterium]
MKEAADFTFEKAVLTDQGILTLSGSVSATEECHAGYSFVLSERSGGRKEEFMAEVVTGSKQEKSQKAQCCINLHDIGFDEQDVVDIYFVSRTGGQEKKTRVKWRPTARRWLPYPTVYGNLSVKQTTS